MSQALAYERAEIPSLTGFLVWMQTDDLEIRRQIDSEGNMIRVMTVHGAKGLESPIVILPDTAKRRAGQKGHLVMAGDTPLWRLRKAEAPKLIADATASEEQREEAERLRLLYVALTRAEKWLIVAAAGELDDTSGNTWYQRVDRAMQNAGAVEQGFAIGAGKRIQTGNWDQKSTQQTPEAGQQHDPLPDFFQQSAPPPAKRKETVSPSDLGGAKALPGDAGLDEEAAKLRGTRIHLLLEHLPGVAPAHWEDMSEQILNLPKAEVKPLCDEATAVLRRPELAHVFDASSLAEVSVTADMAGKRIHGTIDRLLIGEDRILAIDFKSNASVPDRPDTVPEGLLRQMAAYSNALSQVYPERQIDTAILWTRTAELMQLPHDLVSAAGKRAQHLDDI